jgi:hypothetical protein
MYAFLRAGEYPSSEEAQYEDDEMADAEFFYLVRDGVPLSFTSEEDLLTYLSEHFEEYPEYPEDQIPTVTASLHPDAWGAPKEKDGQWFWRVWVPRPNEAPDVLPLPASRKAGA